MRQNSITGARTGADDAPAIDQEIQLPGEHTIAEDRHPAVLPEHT